MANIANFYANSSSTDSDAIQAFFTAVGVGQTDSILYFEPGQGRGPSGRYIIDRKLEFVGSAVIGFDLQQSTMRFTTPQSQIVYTAIKGPATTTIGPEHFFVRNGRVQYSAVIDNLFKWNFPYRDSRASGTGFVEKLRITPQDTAQAHQCQAPLHIKNTWNFVIRDVDYIGKPLQQSALVTDSCFLRQEGLSVVTVLDNCHSSYTDKAVVPVFSPLTAVNGTFTSGGYARDKTVRQGSVIGFFGRGTSLPNPTGLTYALYDVAGGAFVNGPADLIDSAGNVIGSFNITATQVYTDPPQALQICNGSTFITTNHLLSFTTPANALGVKYLDITMTDTHCAPYNSILTIDGVAALTVGSGCFLTPLGTNNTSISVTNGDIISINNAQVTADNANPNNANGKTWVKLRNVNGATVSNNQIFFHQHPVDIDNSVHDAVFAMNANFGTGGIVSAATPFSTGNPHGPRFYGNGAMGIGVDII
ncbi:hypothetical protein [Sphingomonas crusticola]|uniref:hypothetical protein n=1 Tax=Sphingomonas crusticola TaxID=1697973 RepID=UPI000E26C4F4|nr:hypothetical protein [Sphingomonas crusticola]